MALLSNKFNLHLKVVETGIVGIGSKNLLNNAGASVNLHSKYPLSDHSSSYETSLLFHIRRTHKEWSTKMFRS